MNIPFFKASKTQVKNFIKILLNIINAISIITTVAASIATCITVVEMRNERNQLYKPQMIFEKNTYCNDYKKNTWSVSDIRNLIVIKNDENQYPELETSLYNIGSDAALNIEIEFTLDNYQEYIEAITQYYSEDEISVYENKFTITCDGVDIDDYKSENDFSIQKPFLLSGEKLNLTIPKEFCKLLYYLNCCTNGDYSWQPTIHLNIRYSDLQGKKYSNNYELLVNTEMTTIDENNEYWHVNYNIVQGNAI